MEAKKLTSLLASNILGGFWCSSTGTIKEVIQRGVKRIRVTLNEGQRCILVTNNRGDYRVFPHPVLKRIFVEEVV